MEKLFVNFLPPWVETNIQPAFYDKESGSVLQQTARMYAKVNCLVRMFNKLSKETKETVDEYIAKFVELKDFVDTYFENLDVQEEINNKLDAMVEDGTLQEIVGEYLNASAVWGFDSVADMTSSTNLINGSYARTLGFYTKNDGGGALYKIRNVTNDDVIDGAFIIEMGDSGDALIAELIIENDTVNIRQLGARSQSTDNTKYDIAPYINKYLTTANTKYGVNSNKIDLYIPSGVWYSSPLEISGLGFSIRGDEQFIDWYNRGTVITSLQNNQTHVWKFSNSVNFVLKNICFSSADFTYNASLNAFVTNGTSIKNVDYCVRFERMSFGDTDNLYFQHINGTAFELASSWEIRYRKLMFRQVDAHDSCVMKFDKFVSGAPGNGGVNASTFDNMMFEHVLGHLMYLEPSCNLYNCYFGIINFEDNEITRSGVTYTTFNSSNISTFEASNPVHFAVFCLGEAGSNMGECTIDTIQLNNFSTRFSTIGTQNYCYDNIFRVIGDDSLFNVIVNNIDSLGIAKNPTILYSHDTVAWQSSFILNNLNSIAADDKYYVYDVDKFTYIRQDGRRMSQVNGVIPKLTNTATPAYIAIANRAFGRNNMLTSDSAIKNELGVGVKLLTFFASLVFLQASGKLYIRAKIPNGQTARILISGDNINQPENLTGTGSFNIYEVTLDSNSPIGNVLNVALASQNTADYCLVDYFIN